LPPIKVDFPSTKSHFGKIFYPEIPIDVLLATGVYQPISFILDSGADCTLVPYGLAKLVGFKLPSIPDTAVTGIRGGSIPAYKGKLRMRIDGEKLDVRCVFTQSNKTPFLLGRVDFFTVYDINFDSRNSCVRLKK
jgi:hypothetical protein